MVTLSNNISASDRTAFSSILESSGYFYDFEVDVALSLLDESIAKGQKESGYYWIKIIDNDKIAGFAVFGPNPCTTHSWDLYWIAIHEQMRNKHLGAFLLKAVEESIEDKMGRIIWIETSGRPLYEPTQHFYIKNGYELHASLKNYYGVDDDKLVFRKEISPTSSSKKK
jgi:ribosomal protein S18 acetylase RimI-like enzyme